MSNPVRDAGIAVSLLTLLRVPARWPGDGEHTDAAAWFPLVGGVLGLLLAGLTYGARVIPTLLASVLVLTLYHMASGFLHFDGVADVADAWTVPPERRHEVLKDSRIGTFGVIAVILVVALQVSALSTAIRTAHVLWILVATVPVFGRLAATFACWFGKSARANGLGAAVVGRPSGYGIAVVVFTLAAVVVALALGPDPLILGTAWFALGVVAALVVPHLISLRFGGVTGDVLGASILVVETAMLVVLAIVGGNI